MQNKLLIRNYCNVNVGQVLQVRNLTLSSHFYSTNKSGCTVAVDRCCKLTINIKGAVSEFGKSPSLIYLLIKCSVLLFS